jgi:regulator of replication initiation timing
MFKSSTVRNAPVSRTPTPLPNQQLNRPAYRTRPLELGVTTAKPVTTFTGIPVGTVSNIVKKEVIKPRVTPVPIPKASPPKRTPADFQSSQVYTSRLSARTQLANTEVERLKAENAKLAKENADLKERLEKKETELQQALKERNILDTTVKTHALEIGNLEDQLRVCTDINLAAGNTMKRQADLIRVQNHTIIELSNQPKFYKALLEPKYDAELIELKTQIELLNPRSKPEHITEITGNVSTQQVQEISSRGRQSERTIESVDETTSCIDTPQSVETDEQYLQIFQESDIFRELDMQYNRTIKTHIREYSNLLGKPGSSERCRTVDAIKWVVANPETTILTNEEKTHIAHFTKTYLLSGGDSQPELHILADIKEIIRKVGSELVDEYIVCNVNTLRAFAKRESYTFENFDMNNTILDSVKTFWFMIHGNLSDLPNIIKILSTPSAPGKDWISSAKDSIRSEFWKKLDDPKIKSARFIFLIIIALETLLRVEESQQPEVSKTIPENKVNANVDSYRKQNSACSSPKKTIGRRPPVPRLSLLTL